ncbi:Uncharacterised protein [Edwardsiella hoshinae]|uniref:Phage tail fibre repeat n=1 Tax=Edwardsiella hoshinae TaxID=93378 RepID=A0A376DLB6_9GAMM|nr:phage tail protein [Edwardsiella hoshinae]STC91376.1 Uncharacterised protein [Edwardsiella hoshinae]
MSAKYFAILTNLGAAKMANATALGTKLNVTHMAVGDGGGSMQTPDPGQTALRGERRRAALNMLSVDPNNASQIIAEQVIPENEGGWWIREIGLYDSDGVLIAIANCPETYKPLLQEGSGRTQTIRMVLIVSSTAAVTLKIDPAVVLATREYVDRKLEGKQPLDSTLTAISGKSVAGLIEYLGLGAGAFGIKNVAVFTKPGVTTWTVPDELKNGRKAKVTVIGGGASGGRGPAGGGGGGGGLATKVVDLSGVSSVRITVGVGGEAIPSGDTATNGKNGGTSSFGSMCSATGGISGGTQSGQDGGVGVGGDFNTSLGPGGPGTLAGGNTSNSGPGGGPGGPGTNSGNSADGRNAKGPGGGGSGAAWGATQKNCVPGAGFDGIVIVEW